MSSRKDCNHFTAVFEIVSRSDDYKTKIGDKAQKISAIFKEKNPATGNRIFK